MNHSIFDVLGIISDFDEELAASHDKVVSTRKHLNQMDRLNFSVPNFSRGLDWLNVSEELNLGEHLKGKLVVLDFFTYCCINCMHILPDLEAVEEQFPSSAGVAVIGVHSAKFFNEKVTANIISAVLRYNIQHPVVNDENAEMWQALAVSCWPTLVFVGPDGQLLYSVAGEGHREKVIEFLKVATDYYADKLNKCDLPMRLEKDKAPVSSLSFPGKICLWSAKQSVIISDTGNHRIIVTDLQGVVKHVIGTGQVGFQDGSAKTAKFSSPQGVACDKTNIYVADTGNHALRQIAFGNGQIKVTTLSGTGHQGNDKNGGKIYSAQELSSPWDLVCSKTPDGEAPLLLVAMAGNHQIWVFFLADGQWYKGMSYPVGTCLRFAGSGMEENRNNSYPEKASFAQPSGLAISPKSSRNVLYIADSESSSVRSISLDNCKVSNVVGGERDPTNLFAFGDSDGKGFDAKLQHPLGVALLEDKLVVADSYNHKIKCVDLNTNVCETVAGTGQPGATVDPDNLKMCQFNEPGGLATDEVKKLVYIADTNNNAIKVLNLEKKSVHQMPIVFPKAVDQNTEGVDLKPVVKAAGKKEAASTLPDVTTRISVKQLSLNIPIELTEGQHLNTEAPNSWKLSASDDFSIKFITMLPSCDRKGELMIGSKSNTPLTHEVSLCVKVPQGITPGTLTLGLDLQIFVCLDDENVCLPPKTLHFKQVVSFTL
ncbi:NHL repeat-containing protein 2-like [Elysia marginata]|uniref:NHL repeat-containing protein 2-like n=1 Tax=Elysia marginata TaxID=1093978 RepID=A0AAV4EZL5_9GAST|nr:NHL repeat-containing protein 2-like [Elysia marginata]